MSPQATTGPASEQEGKFSEWVVLELMGHRKLAGLLTEQEIAGHGFLRIEIPGAPAAPAVHKHVTYEYPSDSARIRPGHDPGDSTGRCGIYCREAREATPPSTQFYSAAAVYAITPTTESVARRMMAGLRYEPVQRFEVPALLAQGDPAEDEPELALE